MTSGATMPTSSIGTSEGRRAQRVERRDVGGAGAVARAGVAGGAGAVQQREIAGAGLGGQGNTDQHSGRERSGGLAKFIDGGEAAREEAGLIEEIGGWVAADAKLRKDGKAGAGFGGALTGAENLGEVAGEVPDGGVDLG